MATDPERELFATSVLSVVGQKAAQLKESRITGFLAMAGHAYDRELMVIGRAVNGWTDGRCPKDLDTPDEITQYATHVQQKSVAEKGSCPMGWVTAGWGASENYNTKRSAFWRSIRRVVHDLGIADVERQGSDWSSHLVWSNLYKVSPAKGGNPSENLCTIQRPGCIDLLTLELRTYSPKRILFLTGANWASRFLDDATLKDGTGFQYVQQFGHFHGAHCVIAVHPQGKPDQALACEVVTAFDRLQQQTADDAARRR